MEHTVFPDKCGQCLTTTFCPRLMLLLKIGFARLIAQMLQYFAEKERSLEYSIGNECLCHPVITTKHQLRLEDVTGDRREWEGARHGCGCEQRVGKDNGPGVWNDP